MISERAYWLAWLQIKGIGATLLKNIYQYFGSVSQAWEATLVDLQQVEGVGLSLSKQIISQRFKIDPEQILVQHLQSNPHFWTPSDPDYPRLLLEIPSPPPLLYYRGQVDLNENLGKKPAIAIVGTRYPTKYGRDWTTRISETLTQAGFTIVSGMALGIDTAAHTACLQQQGRTIAVLGTGVDIVYPSQNQQLYQAIQQQGLIVSEYPAGTQPNRVNFPARNRIIAGLARGVLIMEAPQRSGALITARYANEFCRDVYVLPGSLDNQQALGCLRLLNNGAHVILGEQELLEMIALMPQLDAEVLAKSNQYDLGNKKKAQQNNDNHQIQTKKNMKPPDLEPELALILQTIEADYDSLDAIASQTNLDTGSLLASLSQLELMGLITQLPGMRYQLN